MTATETLAQLLSDPEPFTYDEARAVERRETGPTLAEYRRMEAGDPNTFWRIDSGDHQNLLEEAQNTIQTLAKALQEVLNLDEPACTACSDVGSLEDFNKGYSRALQDIHYLIFDHLEGI